MENGNPTLVKSHSKSGIDLSEVLEDLSLCPNVQGVMFRKCSCNSSWCPVCGLPAIRERMAEIYKSWDHRHVRTYVLTVDRDLYESPIKAFFEIQREKELAEFMRRLKKRLIQHGMKILDYIWILEWHADGFPHWHCLVLVNKKGKAGRIAQKVDLTELCGKARFVKEGYIHDQEHWAALAGYVAKHGYFGDGKKDQARLPSWALNLPKTGPGKIRIKRMERMRRDLRNGDRGRRERKAFTENEKRIIARLDEIFGIAIEDEEGGEFELIQAGKTTWGECLKSCGAKTIMTVQNKVFNLTVIIGVAYREIKEMGGEYNEGYGWVIPMDTDRILGLLRLEDELLYYNRMEFDTFDDLETEISHKPMEQTYIPF